MFSEAERGFLTLVVTGGFPRGAIIRWGEMEDETTTKRDRKWERKKEGERERETERDV